MRKSSNSDKGVLPLDDSASGRENRLGTIRSEGSDNQSDSQPQQQPTNSDLNASQPETELERRKRLAKIKQESAEENQRLEVERIENERKERTSRTRRRSLGSNSNPISVSEIHRVAARRSLSNSQTYTRRIQNYAEEIIGAVCNVIDANGYYDANEPGINIKIKQIRSDLIGVLKREDFPLVSSEEDKKLEKKEHLTDVVKGLISEYGMDPNGRLDLTFSRAILDLLKNNILIKNNNPALFKKMQDCVIKVFLEHFQLFWYEEDVRILNKDGLQFARDFLDDVDSDGVTVPGFLSWYKSYKISSDPSDYILDKMQQILQKTSPREAIWFKFEDYETALYLLRTPGTGFTEKDVSKHLVELSGVIINSLEDPPKFNLSVDEFSKIFQLARQRSEISKRANKVFIASFLKFLDVKHLSDAELVMLKPLIRDEYHIERDSPIKVFPGIKTISADLDATLQSKVSQIQARIDRRVADSRMKKIENFQDFLYELSLMVRNKKNSDAQRMIRHHDRELPQSENLDKIAYFVRTYRFFSEQVIDRNVLVFLLLYQFGHPYLQRDKSNPDIPKITEDNLSDEDCTELLQIFDKWSLGQKVDPSSGESHFIGYFNPTLLLIIPEISGIYERVMKKPQDLLNKELDSKFKQKDLQGVISLIEGYKYNFTFAQYKKLMRIYPTSKRIVAALTSKFFSQLGYYDYGVDSDNSPIIQSSPFDIHHTNYAANIKVIDNLFNDSHAKVVSRSRASRDGVATANAEVSVKAYGIQTSVRNMEEGENKDRILKILDEIRYRILYEKLVWVALNNTNDAGAVVDKVVLSQTIWNDHRDVKITPARFVSLMNYQTTRRVRTVCMINYFKDLNIDDLSNEDIHEIAKVNHQNHGRGRHIKRSSNFSEMIAFMMNEDKKVGSEKHINAAVIDGVPIDKEFKEMIAQKVASFQERLSSIDFVADLDFSGGLGVVAEYGDGADNTFASSVSKGSLPTNEEVEEGKSFEFQGDFMENPDINSWRGDGNFVPRGFERDLLYSGSFASSSVSTSRVSAHSTQADAAVEVHHHSSSGYGASPPEREPLPTAAASAAVCPNRTAENPTFRKLKNKNTDKGHGLGEDSD